MDIVFLVVTIAAALMMLERSRMLTVIVAAWALCVAMVGWGPAHNADVHTTTPGFWIPWLVVLVIGLLLGLGINALRSRRASRQNP